MASDPAPLTDEPKAEHPCRMCQRPAIDHDGKTIAHLYVGPDAPARLATRTPPGEKVADRRITQGPPPDMILRMALIDAGLITVEQLEAAERKVKALGPGSGGRDRSAGSGEGS